MIWKFWVSKTCDVWALNPAFFNKSHQCWYVRSKVKFALFWNCWWPHLRERCETVIGRRTFFTSWPLKLWFFGFCNAFCKENLRPESFKAVTPVLDRHRISPVGPVRHLSLVTHPQSSGRLHKTPKRPMVCTSLSPILQTLQYTVLGTSRSSWLYSNSRMAWSRRSRLSRYSSSVSECSLQPQILNSTWSLSRRRVGVLLSLGRPAN